MVEAPWYRNNSRRKHQEHKPQLADPESTSEFSPDKQEKDRKVCCTGQHKHVGYDIDQKTVISADTVRSCGKSACGQGAHGMVDTVE